MSFERTWSDDDLRKAVSASNSWRSVSQALGLRSASGSSVVRAHAERLGLDYSHFRGKRTWSLDELRAAVSASSSWAEVMKRLGLAPYSGGSITIAKSHARRLGINTAHLDPPLPELDEVLHKASTKPENIRTAAESIAMAWFLLRGWIPSVPVEPCAYDLLVDLNGHLKRVQVKTMTYRGHQSGWEGGIIRPGTGNELTLYDPDEIDLFFIVDGDMALYLVPMAVVAGLQRLRLTAYQAYRVGSAQSLMVDGFG